jgi:hypothetical protein
MTDGLLAFDGTEVPTQGAGHIFFLHPNWRDLDRKRLKKSFSAISRYCLSVCSGDGIEASTSRFGDEILSLRTSSYGRMQLRMLIIAMTNRQAVAVEPMALHLLVVRSCCPLQA